LVLAQDGIRFLPDLQSRRRERTIHGTIACVFSTLPAIKAAMAA
jgi:hypothetical protein